MLKLSRRLDYAILAVTHLAAGEDGPVSARVLAERSRIPPAILANILKDLQRAGLVRSARGVHGGYELQVTPPELSVGTLVSILEGPTRLVECVELPDEDPDHPHGCQLAASCRVKAPLQRVHQRILDVLDELTIEDLVTETLAVGGDGREERWKPSD